MRINDAHREKLYGLLHFALVEVSALRWASKAEQATDLADAFHNLPKDMWKEGFSLEYFRDAFLTDYQQEYPEGRLRDYVAVVNKMLADGQNPSAN